jgi:UDP-N-acetylglucosamine 4,6-dehydratase
MSNWIDGRSVLVTGGTGSFGRRLIRTLLDRHRPNRVVIVSRDELKQHEMRTSGFDDPRLRYFIGDVRDVDRLRRAFDGVDVVIHAAALKQVPACEYNPFEAIKTNVIGAQNVIEAAIDRKVKRVVALSTDKACNPVNLYGASKLCSDKLFVAGNHYSGEHGTRFAAVRYGNVVGSRGSVIPLFIQQRKTGRLTLTHPDMTRFWITLQQGVDFVLSSLESMTGGEIFVPKIPSTKIVDLARVIGPDCDIVDVGIRPGEKLHEVMIAEDDSRATIDLGDHYVICPSFAWWDMNGGSVRGGNPVPEGFRYSSDLNDDWLDTTRIAELVKPFLSEAGS